MPLTPLLAAPCGEILGNHEAASKEAYEALHPEAKHGGDRKSDQVANSATRSYADDQAEKTGASARTIRQDAERGAKISERALAMLKGTPLDTGKLSRGTVRTRTLLTPPAVKF